MLTVVDDWSSLRNTCVLFEDEAVLVLNKPAGISVMGERHETDIVRLAKDSGEELFPVHRIDKVTSGAILFAKELRFHGDLTRQFNRRTVAKAYLAITRSTGLPEWGTIDLPLSVGRKNRVRIAAERAAIVADAGRWSVAPDAVFTHVRTYPSVTTFATVCAGHQDTLLVVRPVTGRRHQIRVHLAWIGHEINGDPLFDRGTKNFDRGTKNKDGKDKAATTRTLLHSWRLAFDAAWLGGERIDLAAPPGPDFWAPVSDRLDETPETLLRQADPALDRLREHAGHLVPVGAPDESATSED
jgi:tRNA pseudouridine32 synthase/23S rRNA pseudouridine746 synthase/23S rRNA pseudouridine1911/1915/1917 synthase